MSRQRVLKCILLLFFVLIIFAVVIFFVFRSDDPVMEAMDRVPESQMPSDVWMWVDQNRQRVSYSAFYHQDKLYLAVTMGQRPTGGYSVILGNEEYVDQHVRVTVEHIKPKPWDMVTQVLTYPYTVVSLTVDHPPRTVFFLSKDGKTLSRTVTTILGD